MCVCVCARARAGGLERWGIMKRQPNQDLMLLRGVVLLMLRQVT